MENEELKTLEDETKKLRESNEMWEKIFRSIFHDLKNPVNNLIGLVSILGDAPLELSLQEKKDILERILTSAERIGKLIDQFSSWSEYLGGGSEALSEVNLDHVVEEELFLLGEPIKKKEVGVDMMFRNVTFVSHEQTVSFAIRNLLSNAIKFTGKGGSIVIHAVQMEKQIRVLVSDSGAGMSEEHLQKLFAPMNSTPGTNGEIGTGFGLTLVKFFVERIGGTISAESEIGRGTTFFLTFPESQ